MRNPQIEEIEAKLQIAMEQFQRRTPEALEALAPVVMASRRQLLLEWQLDVGDETLHAGLIIATAKFLQIASLQCATGQITHQAHESYIAMADLILSLREPLGVPEETGVQDEEPTL